MNKITQRIEEIESHVYEQEMFRYYPTVSLDSFSMIRGDTSSVKGVGLKESWRKKRDRDVDG